jgi:hypothetical protein
MNGTLRCFDHPSSQQTLCGYSEFRMQAFDHPQSQWSPATEDFINTVQPSYHRLEVLYRKAALLRAEFYCIYGVRKIHRKVDTLISFNQGN